MTTYADGKCRNSARKMADGQPNMGRFSGCRRAIREFRLSVSNPIRGHLDGDILENVLLLLILPFLIVTSRIAWRQKTRIDGRHGFLGGLQNAVAWALCSIAAPKDCMSSAD